MKMQQSGFTLIELVMVIVILGILAATALPRFADLSAEANEAATQGLAGTISGANAVNMASCAAGHANCTAVIAAQSTDGADSDAKCSTAAGLVTEQLTLGTLQIINTTAAAGGTGGVCQVQDEDGANGVAFVVTVTP